jgi:hypothetical protein
MEEIDNPNLTNLSDREKFIDSLDRAGKIKLAKIHGSAQRVYHIPNEYEADSIIKNNIF